MTPAASPLSEMPVAPAQPSPSSPTIYVASDHRGFEQKQQIVEFLKNQKLDVIDLGPQTLNPEDDYPVYARRVAEAVRDNAGTCGILLCGSAHGISIAANRYRGVRAIVAYSEELAKLGREHNDANVLCLSADFSSLNLNEKIILSFLTADFLNEERFARRIEMLDYPTEQPDIDSRLSLMDDLDELDDPFLRLPSEEF